MSEPLLAGISRTCSRVLCIAFLASGAVATTLLAGGCGGPSAEERFAESVCSATLPRAQEILETYDDVKLTRAAPGPEARAQMLRFILRGEEIATRLRAELAALAVPDTDAGAGAKSYLESFGRVAFETMAEAERRVRDLPENITLVQSIRGLQRLELDLLNVLFILRTADGTVKTQIPELKEPFEKASSCEELNALGTD